MNYIHIIQRDLASQIATVESFKQALQDFRVYLHSAKFTGQDIDGERKDWISTGDVLAMLRAIEQEALNAGERTFSEWTTPNTKQN